MLDNEYAQKKKLFIEKNEKDIRRTWKYSLTYVDVILR